METSGRHKLLKEIIKRYKEGAISYQEYIERISIGFPIHEIDTAYNKGGIK